MVISIICPFIAPFLIKYKIESNKDGIYFNLIDMKGFNHHKKYLDKLINFLQAPVVIFVYSQVF